MNLDDRIRRHFEARVPSEEPADIADVLARGNRLRGQTYAATAFFSVAGLGMLTLAVAISLGVRTSGAEVASLSDSTLQDQIDASWTPVPDPVDPELVINASSICPFDNRVLTQAPQDGTPAGPPELLVIDQRGITAEIIHGMKTTTGEVATTCSAVKIDGEWRNADGIDVDWPPLSYSSGGVPSEYVAEIRLRFPDGTEVAGSVGNMHYFVSYPSALWETLTEPNSYVYIDSYTADGTFIASEIYMSSRDRERIESLVSLVGEPLPRFPGAHIAGTSTGARLSDATVTVMVVWTPSCSHCLDQLAVVQEIADAFDDHVSFVGIVMQTTPEEAEAMLRSSGISFHNSIATGNPDLNDVGIGAIPMTLIADATGTVVEQLPGLTDAEELEQAIAAALG